MAQQIVDDFIQKNKVMVFSKSYCPYCRMAKSALESTGVKFEVLEIEDRADCDDIQTYLQSITGARSVPRVFLDGKFIGGGSDVKDLQESGKLVPLLKKAGALE